METQSFIDELKDNMILANFPPTYDNDLDYYNLARNHNCYSYAMQLKANDFDIDLIDRFFSFPFNPGLISLGKELDYNKKNLIKAFITDCKILGVKCTLNDSLNAKLLSNEYRIAIYLGKEFIPDINGRDFHFIRQNDDGTWSEMRHLRGAVRKVDNILEIPDYNLVNIARVRKI